MDFIGTNDIRSLPGKVGFLIIFLLTLNFFGFSNAVAEGKSETRRDLEQVLRAYLEGCSERDFQKLQGSMAEVSLATMRNKLVSLKKEFPPSAPSDFNAWEGITASFFSFDKMSFIALKEIGRRAILTYRYPAIVKDSDGEHDGFFTADFVRMGEEWKVVKTGAIINSALIKELDKGDRNFLNEPDFTPGTIIPEVPPTATPADYIAQCQWYIPAGKLVVTVNGIPNEINSMSGFKVILGGLKKGENKIKIQYDPNHSWNGGKGQGDPKLRINVFTGNDLKTGTDRQLFVYKWKAEVIDHEEIVQINDQILGELVTPERVY